MAAAGPEALARALAGGRRGGVFFLYGDEEHLKEEAVAEIVAAHLDPATRDFNLDQLRGSELDEETFVSRLATPPLLADWRVVVVREAQALAGSPRLRQAVERVLERPVPGLALVLVARPPEGGRAQFYERLRRRAFAVECGSLSPGDAPGWVIARARAAGLALEPAAARALVEAVGPELGVLLAELGKLADYAAARGRTRIGEEDVAAVVGAVPRATRWAWFDLVGERRFREARAALPALLDAGESGVGLVLGLGTHLLRLAIAAVGGAPALQAELPAHQRWLASRLAAQARRWTADGLERALEDLLRADRLLKSGALGDRAVLEELLLRWEAQ